MAAAACCEAVRPGRPTAGATTDGRETAPPSMARPSLEPGNEPTHSAMALTELNCSMQRATAESSGGCCSELFVAAIPEGMPPPDGGV